MTSLEQLFRRYCQAWEDGNIRNILAPLAENVFIKECYGPQYQGQVEVKNWAKKWLAENKVIKWEIKNVLVEGASLASEWEFAFQKSGGKIRSFSGSSFVDFSKGKISRIYEYWQTTMIQ